MSKRKKGPPTFLKGPSQNLTVTISLTAQGDATYMQIMSADMLSLNIVLVAPVITVRDKRPVQDGRR